MNRLSLPGPLLRWALAGALLCLGCSSLPSAAAAQNSLPAAERSRVETALNGLRLGHSIGQVAVSPDGQQLAWIAGGEIHVAPLNHPDHSHRITAATASDQRCEEGEFTWAPDSRALAFLSDCAHRHQQFDLYRAPIDGSSARRLTELHGYVQAPAFSPDGRQIAFLYVEGASRPAGALAAQTPPAGVIGEDDIEVQRIAVVPADAAQPAAPAFATPAGLHVYEFDWSPGSQSLAYVAADPPGENNWWVARLYTQALGAAPRMILAPATVSGPLHGLQIAVPRWSPGGQAIAFIGGLMSDQGATGGDVWVVPAAGGAPTNLTPNRPSTPAWLTWSSDHALLVHEIAGGDCQLVRLDLRGDPATSPVTATAGQPIFRFPGTVGDGVEEMSLSTTAGRSLLVFRASSFDRPPEIFAARPVASGQPEAFAPLTHFNEGVHPSWGQSVSLRWKNQGFDVQGWLTLPAHYDPAKKYPLIVEVHGGPSSAALGRWGGGGGLSPAVFSELGYFVLQPNPRGSFGQGEAFAQANRKDFGYGDLRDILAGVDTVLAKYPVDPRRVGLTGWSYGGFMTMFATTQTNRFRAAVAGAGISDWLSYSGENSIDQWMVPFFGASVYDDPAVYAKSSAIDFIKQAHTPTLIVVGDRDGECPAPQSFEMWHGLRAMHVPTQLVVYPNEGHGFADPLHRRDVLERAVAWFDRYLPPGS